MDNIDNLSPSFKANIVDRYAGTRMAARELEGQDVDDTPGALFTAELLERTRWITIPVGVELVRVGVGVDPSGGGENMCGIVVGASFSNGHRALLDDRSVLGLPPVWAEAVVAASEAHNAGRIYAERNFGGEMVRTVLLAAGARVGVELVNASTGKHVRAEPVATAWDREVCHILGRLPELEEEMTTWTPESGWSPNRLDAAVWVMTALEEKPSRRLRIGVRG